MGDFNKMFNRMFLHNCRVKNIYFLDKLINFLNKIESVYSLAMAILFLLNLNNLNNFLVCFYKFVGNWIKK